MVVCLTYLTFKTSAERFNHGRNLSLLTFWQPPRRLFTSRGGLSVDEGIKKWASFFSPFCHLGMFRLKTASHWRNTRGCDGWWCCLTSRWDDETRSRTVGFTDYVIKDLSRAKTPNSKVRGFDNCGKISEQQWSAVSVDLKVLVKAAACQGHCRSCWTFLHWHPCRDAVELKWMRGCVSSFF